MSAGFKVRSGQLEFERFVAKHRITGLLARRQYGKTTIASRIALKKMMKVAGHTVVFGSVKLDLGREIVRKEAEAMQKAISVLMAQAAAASTQFDVVDLGGRSVKAVNADDFADLYENSRLEFRLWHSNTIYSRTKVVALTPAAVGDTGDLILDEVGRVKGFRSVWEAAKPIIASNPLFRCILTTTPPPDDSHFSFELLAPPVGTEFTPNPKGNTYQSDLGVHVLRIDAWDAAVDGVPLYDDDTGQPITPEESRAKDPDKDAWDRNYGVKFVLGGSAAIGLLQLDAAQNRGLRGERECRFLNLGSITQVPESFGELMGWLRQRLGTGRVGLGYDVATTDGGVSNPSSMTAGEELGVERIFRATVAWKSREPELARYIAGEFCKAVEGRAKGGRARRLCIDASSEKYFCQDMKRYLRRFGVPVELVVSGETLPQPGGDSITMKALVGNDLVKVFDDNQATIAPDRYVKNDMRLVRRDRGSFSCEVGPNGEHGDTFDSHKLSNRAMSSAGTALASTDGIRWQRSGIGTRRIFTPRRLS